MPITAEKLAELRALHPRAVFADVAGHPEIELVVAPPTDAVWSLVKKQVGDKSVDSNATLSKSCLVFPDPNGDEYRQLVALYPTLPDHIARVAGELAGSDFKVTTRKL